MEQLEVFVGDGIFVTLAQESLIVGALQILNLGGITAELLIIAANRARILHSAMNHFLFAVTLDLECHRLHHRGGGDDHQRNHEQQRQQNITPLAGIATATAAALRVSIRSPSFSPLIFHTDHYLTDHDSNSGSAGCSAPALCL